MKRIGGFLMSDKLFIKGTLILTLTGLVSRLMGFFYRIFLSHTIGAQGVGIYQLTLPVHAIVLAACCMGNSGCYFQAVCLFHCPWEKKKSPEMRCFLEHFFRWHFADFYLFWSIGMQILWLLPC